MSVAVTFPPFSRKEDDMPRKAIIVISDTHIGAGGAPEGNRLEDFISDAEFVDWLHDLVEESNRDNVEMDLVINGDWIEYLQIPDVKRFEPYHPYDTVTYADVSEAAALRRLEIVHEWHPSIFLGLSDFLNPGPPRRSLTILYGNHDPELAYPGVQARIREILHVDAEHADLVTVGQRRYFKHGVYIEHGNAYTEEVDRFSNPDSPFDPNNPSLIERPNGSHFVTHFFNRVEWERPWVDGVHPMTTLVFYAIAFEPAFALKILRTLLRVLPDILQRLHVSEEGEQVSTGQALLAQLETPAQEKELLQKLESDPAFKKQFVRQVQRALGEKGVIAEDWLQPQGIEEGIDPVARAREITEQYWQWLEDAAERVARAQQAQVVLFGHIHERIEKQLSSGATYLNTGTWVWKGHFKDAPDRVWQDLLVHPEKYMYSRDLTYARVDLDEDGIVRSARLHRVGEPPAPPEPPGDLPKPSLWARLLLALRALLRRLFAG
ncbi:MAG: hypothetical protein D6775_08730 [Caldilineae bacterium]|nr:MAG: hypothetical protein D6775_08730 [Caldilineae bacterium]